MTSKSRRRTEEPQAPHAEPAFSGADRERRSSSVSLRDVIESIPWAQIERRVRKEVSTTMLAAGEWLTAIGGGLAGREAPAPQASSTRKRAGATANDAPPPAPVADKRQASGTAAEAPPPAKAGGKAKPGASKAATRVKPTTKAATKAKSAKPAVAGKAAKATKTPASTEADPAQGGLRFPDDPA
jgi:hypothetical protein